MKPKNRAYLLILVLAALCGGAVWGMVWYRARPINIATMRLRLPTVGAVLMYIDFDALRRSGIGGILDSSKVHEDSDYRSFAQRINFDYKQDLDAVMVAFAPQGKYMFVRGRFDWKSLRSYVAENGGRCEVTICNMQGSTADKRISFAPVQSNLMALAVGKQESAVRDIGVAGKAPAESVPSAPVWISIPSEVLKSSESLPAGTRMFARPMRDAEAVTLEFHPDGQRLAARLNVQCRNEQDATDVASALTQATAALRKMLELERQTPDPSNLAAVLSSGSFKSEGKRVVGYWPIERTLLESILNGGVS